MTQQHLSLGTHEAPRFCAIWLHGLGADANDMLGLAQCLELNDQPIKHIFLNAPHRPITLNQGVVMRGWYDILSLSAGSREDKEGVLEAHQIVDEVIQKEIQAGFAPQQIFLCGFSQGGAMALFAGLQTADIGGIVSLSAYLPIATACSIKASTDTPIFMGYGQLDEIVNPNFTLQTIQHLKLHGLNNITSHAYPIGHSVSPTELTHLSNWFKARMNPNTL